MSEIQTTNYLLTKAVVGTNNPVDGGADLWTNFDTIDAAMNRFERQVFSVSGTWNKPAGAKRVVTRVIGGGGGSGGVAATSGVQLASAGGGGGGGYSEKLFLASALANSETVDVGAAGAAGAAGANNGGAGGTSNFATGKAYVVSATGGGGGTGGTASGGFFNSVGGAGGSGSGGDLNEGGSAGGTGLVLSAAAAYAANFGGASPRGGSATPAVSNTSGSVGQPYGGGASGALNNISQGTRAGSAGAAGLVVVDTYF